MSKSPTTQPTESALLARVEAINRQMLDLSARRVADVLKIVALEEAGRDRPQSPRESEVRERVASLLGAEPIDLRANELADLILDRDAIDQAIAILRARLVAAEGAVVEARLSARAPEWRSLVRKRLLTIAALRRLNDEVDAFGASIACGSIRPPLDLAWPSAKLLGGGKSTSGTGLAAYEYLEAAVKAGVITRQEIANA